MNAAMVALGVLASAQTQAATVIDTASKAAHDAKMLDFQQNDPWGFGVTIISMLIVMLALIVIYFVFKAIGPVVDRTQALKLKRQTRKASSAAKVMSTQGSDAEVAAVIALALHMHLQAMREDDVISLTIKEISRRYSPWNDKGFAAMNNQISLRRRSN